MKEDISFKFNFNKIIFVIIILLVYIMFNTTDPIFSNKQLLIRTPSILFAENGIRKLPKIEELVIQKLSINTKLAFFKLLIKNEFSKLELSKKKFLISQLWLLVY